jgi:hypothetical protein
MAQTTGEILAAAQALIADRELASNIKMIYASAECDGPQGSFQTQIWSARQGYVRFEQRSSRGTTIAAISQSTSWALDGGEVMELDEPTEAFLHSHELHLIALDPLSRFSAPSDPWNSEFMGQRALEIQFQDMLGHPVSLYYDPAQSYPLGMCSTNPFDQDADDIEIQFQSWKDLESGACFFTKASFHQSGEVWKYEYTSLEINNFEMGVFEPSTP